MSAEIISGIDSTFLSCLFGSELAGAAMPAGAKFYFYIEWTESDV